MVTDFSGVPQNWALFCPILHRFCHPQAAHMRMMLKQGKVNTHSLNHSSGESRVVVESSEGAQGMGVFSE